MPILGISFFPHGSILLERTENSELEKLADSLQKASRNILDKKPAKIVLITPHGILLDHNTGIYLSSKVRGSAEWDGKFGEYKIDASVDLDGSKRLLEYLRKESQPVEGITIHTRSYPINIGWGEVVPLYHVYSQQSDIPLIILSLPFRRYEHPELMRSEMKQFGTLLGKFCQAENSDFWIIISGDLAHTHQKESIYGYSSTSEEFDKLVKGWLSSRLSDTKSSESILDKADQIVNQALSCGYLGIYMLDGLLNESYTLDELFYASPTYFGMIVANFVS